MSRYVAKRLVSSIALLFLSTIIIFLLMRVIPGDPTITKLGGSIKEVDEADDIFTKLMGDVVEPRREFIQDNSLSANVDV